MGDSECASRATDLPTEGTGAVTLAAITSACHVKGEKLSDQRIIIHGAGTAGLGVADRIAKGMVEVDGLSYQDAAKRLSVALQRCRAELTASSYMIDRDGLLTKGMGDKLRPGIEPFARPDAEVQGWERDATDKSELRLIDVVKACKPTVLVHSADTVRMR